LAETASEKRLKRIEESQGQLRDSIEASKRLTGEAQALVDQAHERAKPAPPGPRAPGSSS
jgi:hypothetical protein